MSPLLQAPSLRTIKILLLLPLGLLDTRFTLVSKPERMLVERSDADPLPPPPKVISQFTAVFRSILSGTNSHHCLTNADEEPHFDHLHIHIGTLTPSPNETSSTESYSRSSPSSCLPNPKVGASFYVLISTV
ncbi:hypothetical protein ACLB2K_059423 [Fragaria x ananassa]